MTDNARHLSGAYRRSFRHSRSQGESFSYEICSSCGLVAQLLVENRSMGLGSSTSFRRPDPATEAISQIKAAAEKMTRSESLRRAFRAADGRCTCDPAHDALVMNDQRFADERVKRDNDLSRPDEAPAGWHPDPYKRAQYRLWNGRVWTDLVSNNGAESIDIPGTRAVQRTATPASIPAQRTSKAKRGPRTGRSDLTGQLRELNDLYEAGVLTEAQFEAAKNKLLGLD